MERVRDPALLKPYPVLGRGEICAHIDFSPYEYPGYEEFDDEVFLGAKDVIVVRVTAMSLSVVEVAIEPNKPLKYRSHQQ